MCPSWPFERSLQQHVLSALPSLAWCSPRSPPRAGMTAPVCVEPTFPSLPRRLSPQRSQVSGCLCSLGNLFQPLLGITNVGLATPVAWSPRDGPLVSLPWLKGASPTCRELLATLHQFIFSWITAPKFHKTPQVPGRCLYASLTYSSQFHEVYASVSPDRQAQETGA